MSTSTSSIRWESAEQKVSLPILFQELSTTTDLIAIVKQNKTTLSILLLIFLTSTLFLLNWGLVLQIASLEKNQEDALDKLKQFHTGGSSVGSLIKFEPQVPFDEERWKTQGSCSKIQKSGSTKVDEGASLDPKQRIFPFLDNGASVEALCDFDTDGGAWTYIQKRGVGPKWEFYLGWDDYENGFGDVGDNFWIGLKTMHALTARKNGAQELRIELEDWEGNKTWAQYEHFQVGNASDKYRLSIGGYSGDAGDGMAVHNGMRFSTKDQDNDSARKGSCAINYHGAWWYQDCLDSNLNGLYLENGTFQNQLMPDGIIWHEWKGVFYSLRRVQMKVRNAKTK